MRDEGVDSIDPVYYKPKSDATHNKNLLFGYRPYWLACVRNRSATAAADSKCPAISGAVRSRRSASSASIYSLRAIWIQAALVSRMSAQISYGLRASLVLSRKAGPNTPFAR